MNFKNSEFLMLVAAFLLGYFFQEMMKGCQIMEGLSEPKTEDEKKNDIWSNWITPIAGAEMQPLKCTLPQGAPPLPPIPRDCKGWRPALPTKCFAAKGKGPFPNISPAEKKDCINNLYGYCNDKLKPEDFFPCSG